MAEPTPRRARRSPEPPDRQRDPERSRERIVDAALEEFGEKGFAGARVSEIAARAGVNKQLISYYFGGKEGLYEELARRWRDTEATLAGPELPLPEVVANYARTAVTHRSWARLLIWNALADHASASGGGAAGGPATGETAAVDDLRARQRSGELASDLDPACVLLALMAAATAPVTLPQMVRGMCDADPHSEEFNSYYAEQLARLVSHLAEPPAS